MNQLQYTRHICTIRKTVWIMIYVKGMTSSSEECTVNLMLGYMRALSASPGAGFSFKGYISVVQLKERMLEVMTSPLLRRSQNSPKRLMTKEENRKVLYGRKSSL